jgi:serine/threonine-protein kinase RsbW
MVLPTEIPVHAIELCIDSRLENLDLLGAAVSGIAAALGFDESERYHLELCAVEAVSNSVRHAYHGVPGRPVRVRIAVSAEHVEMRVADQGDPIPEERRLPPKLDVDPADLDAISEGGRGIFLMHSLMDEVSFGGEAGWSFVALTKRRRQP